jgi:hypothetical protein
LISKKVADVLGVAGDEIVDASDATATLDETGADVRPEETSSA